LSDSLPTVTMGPPSKVALSARAADGSGKREKLLALPHLFPLIDLT
jgi:hypothetical protein